LEAVHRLHPLLCGLRPRDGDGRLAECFLVTLDPVVEDRKDNNLFAGCDDIAYPLGNRLMLGLVKGDANLGQAGQELRVVRPFGVGGLVPLEKGFDRVQGRGCGRDMAQQPSRSGSGPRRITAASAASSPHSQPWLRPPKAIAQLGHPPCCSAAQRSTASPGASIPASHGQLSPISNAQWRTDVAGGRPTTIIET
jgi:hypothetical protein